MLNFRTPYGDHYKVDENACIIRQDRQTTPSGKWTFEGLRHVRSNEFIPLKDLTREFVKDFNTCWKNGNPCYTAVDMDHGTRRIWCNTKYHGVSRIWYDNDL